VALLFGLHPLRVESVAWISERKDVLSTLFWMATLWAYAEWAERALSQRPGRGWFYALSLVCLALGLMSKPMLVTVPFVLLLIDFWPLGRLRLVDGSNARQLIVEKLPFFALAAAACVVTYFVQRQGGAMKEQEVFPITVRIANAGVSYARYLAQFLWPIDLAVYYPHPGMTLPSSTILLSATTLLLLTGIAVWQWRVRPWLAVGWLWYLGTLVPAIGLVQVGAQAMADRYTYVPLLGVMIALVWTLHEVMTRWRVPVAVAAAAVTACLVASALQTRAQIGYWKTSETLFRHAVQVTQRNAVAHVNLGIALQTKGATGEAIDELEAALNIEPDLASAHLNLGVILDSGGHSTEAVPHLLRVTQLEPGLPEGYFCLANAWLHQGRSTEAIEAYQQATHLNPNDSGVHFQLGRLYYSLDRYEEALREFREMLRLTPNSADAQNSVGSVLFAEGRLDEAVPYYEAALRLQPNHPDARRNFEALRAAQAAAQTR
jgi:Flp pilus assembly protein TadD